MERPAIIKGQKINPLKLERAKEFRRKQTEEEKILWSHLRRNQLNRIHFRRQQVIYGFIADFFCQQAGVVFEADGGFHKKQTKADEERDRIFAAKGLKVIRIPNEDIRENLSGVLQKILEVCMENREMA